MKISQNKKILIVEDDASIMETLSLLLHYEGFEVLKTRNVGQALELLKTVRPDLVLLDYMLHDDTAEPVVHELRARYRDVVVILLTAVDNADKRGAMIGADSVIRKPFELEALLDGIHQGLEISKSKKSGQSGGV